MSKEKLSFLAVKCWAKRYISEDNELRDALLMEPDTMSSHIEIAMKLDAYSKMLDAKAKRIKAKQTQVETSR